MMRQINKLVILAAALISTTACLPKKQVLSKVRGLGDTCSGAPAGQVDGQNLCFDEIVDLSGGGRQSLHLNGMQNMSLTYYIIPANPPAAALWDEEDSGITPVVAYSVNPGLGLAFDETDLVADPDTDGTIVGLLAVANQ